MSIYRCTVIGVRLNLIGETMLASVTHLGVRRSRRAKHAVRTRSKSRTAANLSLTAPSVDLIPTAAWSRRVRRVGGLIQTAFAAFWLVRGSLVVGGAATDVLIAAFGVSVIGAFAYAIKAPAATAPRPRGPEAGQIERAVTLATAIQLAASFALPVAVIAAGHTDWVLPSIAITIGPLLLWLDHLVHIPRYRPVVWALTIGPFILVATMSGAALAATTGLAAGILLLGTAAAGFHDLGGVRLPRSPRTVRVNPQAHDRPDDWSVSAGSRP